MVEDQEDFDAPHRMTTPFQFRAAVLMAGGSRFPDLCLPSLATVTMCRRVHSSIECLWISHDLRTATLWPGGNMDRAEDFWNCLPALSCWLSFARPKYSAEITRRAK